MAWPLGVLRIEGMEGGLRAPAGLDCVRFNSERSILLTEGERARAGAGCRDTVHKGIGIRYGVFLVVSGKENLQEAIWILRRLNSARKLENSFSMNRSFFCA